jgi:hypothetical protein
MFRFYNNRTAKPIGWAINVISATEAAADPAKNLPNGAATGVAALVAREDKHLLSSFIECVCLAKTRAFYLFLRRNSSCNIW